jgi:hypothetical protein
MSSNSVIGGLFDPSAIVNKAAGHGFTPPPNDNFGSHHDADHDDMPLLQAIWEANRTCFDNANEALADVEATHICACLGHVL